MEAAHQDATERYKVKVDAAHLYKAVRGKEKGTI